MERFDEPHTALAEMLTAWQSELENASSPGDEATRRRLATVRALRKELESYRAARPGEAATAFIIRELLPKFQPAVGGATARYPIPLFGGLIAAGTLTALLLSGGSGEAAAAAAVIGALSLLGATLWMRRKRA